MGGYGINRHVETSLLPRQQGSWGQHGAHLGPTGPRWAPCWSDEPCYLGSKAAVTVKTTIETASE